MKTFNIFTLTLSIAAGASALTLKETKTLNEWKAYLSKDSIEGHSAAVIKNCGYEIPVEIDEKILTPFIAENTSGASYCDATLTSIASLCEDEIAKPMIKKNIKKISCKLGKKEEASFKLSGGTFTFTFGLGSSNHDQKAKTFLENNLN